MPLSRHQTHNPRPTPVMVESALERLGKRIWMARKLRSLTQQELANLSDVSLSTVRALEAGSEGVALGNALKVFQGLGLLDQVEQLLDPHVDPHAVTFAEKILKGR